MAMPGTERAPPRVTPGSVPKIRVTEVPSCPECWSSTTKRTSAGRSRSGCELEGFDVVIAGSTPGGARDAARRGAAGRPRPRRPDDARHQRPRARPADPRALPRTCASCSSSAYHLSERAARARRLRRRRLRPEAVRPRASSCSFLRAKAQARSRPAASGPEFAGPRRGREPRGARAVLERGRRARRRLRLRAARRSSSPQRPAAGARRRAPARARRGRRRSPHATVRDLGAA